MFQSMTDKTLSLVWVVFFFNWSVMWKVNRKDNEDYSVVSNINNEKCS